MKPFHNTNPLLSPGLAPQRARKARFTCLFATAIAAGLSASTALAQNYIPAPGFPLDSSVELNLIQTALTKINPTETLTLPPATNPLTNAPAPVGTDPTAPNGFISPSATDYALAVSNAVATFLATPVNGVTLDSLVHAAAAYRPTKVSVIMPGITTAILSGPGDVGGNLQTATEQAVTVDATAAPAITASVIKTIVAAAAAKGSSLTTTEIDTDEGDATTAGVAAAPALAAKTVAGAIAAVKKSPTASTDADAIATAAIESAITNGATGLIGSIASAATLAVVKNTTTGQAAAVTSVAGSILTAAGAKSATTRADALDLAAGIAAGAGFTNKAAVEAVTGVGATAGTVAAYSSFSTAMGEAVEAYAYVKAHSNISASKNPTIPSAAVHTFISTGDGGNNAANPANLDAVVAGAVAAWPTVAPSIISRVLDDMTGDTNSTVLPAAIITTGVEGSPATAAAVAKLIVQQNITGVTPTGSPQTLELHPVTDVGTAVGAVIAGANPSLVGTIVASATGALATKAIAGGTATPAFKALLGTMVAGSVTAANTAGFSNTIGEIAYNAAKTSKNSVAVLNDVLGTSGITDLEAAEAVAGAVTADPKTALATGTLSPTGTAGFGPSIEALTGNAKLYATTAFNLADAIVNPPVLPKGTPKDPLVYFEQTTKELAALTTASNTDVNQILAVVYAASLANPKGTSSIAAAAVANLPTGTLNATNEAAIVSAAEAASFRSAPNIQAAADAALHVATTNVAGLTNYVSNAVIGQPAYALDIVTGATVAAPGKANFIASAAAFGAPLSVGKVIPALFSFSNIGAAVIPGALNDETARAAAITAAFTTGILEAYGDTATPGAAPANPTLVKPTKTGTSAAQVALYNAQLTTYNTNVALEKAQATNAKSEASALKAAISAAVKASLLLKGQTMATSNGGGTPAAPTSVQAPSAGPAGVVTGYISQDMYSGEAGLQGSTAAVITAAVKAAKGFALEITQAAVEAAVIVTNTNTTTLLNEIEAAVVAGLGTSPVKPTDTLLGTTPITPGEIALAAQFGVTQATATTGTGPHGSIPGAGAAGVVNYALHNATGTPVTSIYEL